VARRADDRVVAAPAAGRHGPQHRRRHISAPYREALRASVDFFAELALEFDNLTPYERGKIVGRSTFEIAAIVVPMTKAGHVSKLSVLNKMKSMPFFQTGAPAAALTRLSGLVDQLKLASILNDGVQVRAISAAKANADWVALSPATNKAPYLYGTTVSYVRTKVGHRFARLFTMGTTSRESAWVIKAEDMFDPTGRALTPTELKNKFALPHLPTHAVDVDVPAGIKVHIGTAGPQPTWGSIPGGGTQIQLMEDIPSSSFKNDRPL